MTALYQSTKVIEAAKDWRVTDKKQVEAHAELKNLSTNDRDVVELHVQKKNAAISEHYRKVQNLRAAVDELAQKGQP